VPLSPAAVDLLRGLPRLDDVDLVFTTTGTTPVSGFSQAKRRLDRLSEVPDWHIHDLRRTVTTKLAEMGTPPHVADRILNHVQGTIRGVAAVYNRHVYLEERRAALEDQALRLAKIVAGA
jgi:integrase